MPTHLNALPADVEGKIWKTYFDKHVTPYLETRVCLERSVVPRRWVNVRILDDETVVVETLHSDYDWFVYKDGEINEYNLRSNNVIVRKDGTGFVWTGPRQLNVLTKYDVRTGLVFWNKEFERDTRIVTVRLDEHGNGLFVHYEIKDRSYISFVTPDGKLCPERTLEVTEFGAFMDFAVDASHRYVYVSYSRTAFVPELTWKSNVVCCKMDGTRVWTSETLPIRLSCNTVNIKGTKITIVHVFRNWYMFDKHTGFLTKHALPMNVCDFHHLSVEFDPEILFHGVHKDDQNKHQIWICTMEENEGPRIEKYAFQADPETTWTILRGDKLYFWNREDGDLYVRKLCRKKGYLNVPVSNID